MGATSVTGVGPGTADAGVKGPGNGRSHFVPQINPHVVGSGTHTMGSTSDTITFPSPLAGSESGYCVFLTNDDSTATWVSAKTDSGGDFVSFEITGGNTDVVMWMVVNAGHGLNA